MAKSVEYEGLMEKCIKDGITKVVLSKASNPLECDKIKIRPVKIKDRIGYQVVKSVGNKASNTKKEVHENISQEELGAYFDQVFPSKFKQALVETAKGGYTILCGKKGNITVIRNKSTVQAVEIEDHNRRKQYIISEGDDVKFLKDLNIMTSDGMVVKAKYDKFRQINRYLEFVRDITQSLPKDRKLTIIDFGCGKSYLTFALYHYLVNMLKLNVHIIGLDLKTDVIRECNRLKNKYGYKDLEFIEGDIEKFEGVDRVDMVVSLHACDTATDYAIYKAIKWGAEVIMAVPCCQHELNRNMDRNALKEITGYGILKERLASIATDAIRANVLREQGYEAQILEFIDMEHTPKNILIRAVKKPGNRMYPSSEGLKDDTLSKLFNTEITLQRLFKK